MSGCGSEQEAGLGDIKLHVGGKETKAGWSILNIQPGPGVNYVGSCVDLSFLTDESCAEVYASHVLEHLSYADALPRALREMHRVLTPGGRLRVSVPDLGILAQLFVHPKMTFQDRYNIMRMMFGGQQDAHDFHTAGLWADLMGALLTEAGFTRVARVEGFGEFKDASSNMYAGNAVSLNVEAFKAG